MNKIILLVYSNKYLFPVKLFLMFFLHIELPKLCKQKNIRLPHAYNIIINPRSHIGENVTIYHNVTIGSKQFGNKVGVPTIGDDVIIYPNSVLIGAIKIGAGSIVGGWLDSRR